MEYSLSLYLTFIPILLLISNSTFTLGNIFIFSILNNIFLYEKHAPLSTCLVYFTVSKISRLTDFNNGIKENRSLKYEVELKDNQIDSLKRELSTKDKIIGRLQTEKEKLKQELQKFKCFWHSIMSHFHKKICYDKDSNYKIVSDDLYKNGIFDNNDNEIANNILRKVTISDEKKQTKNKKKNNDTRF